MIRRRLFTNLSEAPATPSEKVEVPSRAPVIKPPPVTTPIQVPVPVKVPVAADPNEIKIPPLPPEELPRKDVDQKKMTPKQRAKDIMRSTKERHKYLKKIVKDYYGIVNALGLKTTTSQRSIVPRML